MNPRKILPAICLVALCATAAPPPQAPRCPSNGILLPESATTLLATAKRCANDEIDMSEFSYRGCTREFDFEYAWMISKRHRQQDGSDAWKDIICETHSNKTQAWACHVTKQRTVHVESEAAGRVFDIWIADDMNGDLARQIVTPALAEIFRSREMEVCASKERVPVDREEVLNYRSDRGKNASLNRKGDKYQMIIGLYVFHISFDAASDPQSRVGCLDLPEELQ